MKKRPQTLTQKAMQALSEAVAKALEEHRRRGIPIAVWRNGRAVSISPTEAGAMHEEEAPYRTTSHDTRT